MQPIRITFPFLSLPVKRMSISKTKNFNNKLCMIRTNNWQSKRFRKKVKSGKFTSEKVHSSRMEVSEF
jgi:hypothetical protein